MDKEHTQKLIERFPVLYQGFYDDMRNTAMCWGFDCGNGWKDIIWQLSLAIEDELKYTKFQVWKFLFLKKWSKKWNNLVYRISPVGTNDIVAKFFRAICPLKETDAYPESFKHHWYLLGSYWAKLVLGLKMLRWDPYTGLAVTQVKEKYGTLRFYSPGNDRIWHLVDLAERASSLTCEECGEHGKVLGQGWYYAACEKHCKEEDKDQLDESIWDLKEENEELKAKLKKLRAKARAKKAK